VNRPILYVARRSFGPHSENWSGYLDFSRLSLLREVITLDTMLCPSIVTELSDADWQHNVVVDYRGDYFTDFDYLVRRVRSVDHCNLLAVVKRPAEGQVVQPPRAGFVFRGFDLIEAETGISALTNCGGFDRAFTNDELKEVGLLTNLERATDVQKTLRAEYPDEHHARCDVWAIWRFESPIELEGGPRNLS